MACRYFSLFLLLLIPLLVRPQAFTPRRPFILQSASTSSTPSLIILSNIYFWSVANDETTNLASGDGATPLNGESVWKWENKGVVSQVGPAVYNSCNVPIDSQLIWLQTNGPNGKEAVWQTGNTGYLQAGGCSGPESITNPITLFVLFRCTNSTSSGWLFDINQTAGATNYVLFFDWANLYGQASASLLLGPNTEPVNIGAIPANFTNWTLMTLYLSPTNGWLRTNGVEFSTFAYNKTAPMGIFLYLFNMQPNDANYFHGMCSEFLLYHWYPLATNDIRTVEGYFTNKWGLTNYYAP